MIESLFADGEVLLEGNFWILTPFPQAVKRVSAHFVLKLK